jgi:hypothetical protein
MRFVSLILIFSIFALTSQVLLAQTAAPAPEVVAQTPREPLAFGLQDGTPLKLRVNRNLSSADSKTGETIDFEVLEDVMIGETVVIARGSSALGTITRGKPKGRMGKGGKLDINIDSVRTVTGEKIALRAVKETKGKGSTGAMTGAIVASSILFFPAAPFFLFMKGKDVKIPKGTEVTAYVNGDSSLDRGKFAALQTKSGEETTVADPETSIIAIKSTPEGAEISVDGKYVGSTPSTLTLKSGDHTISIKKTGFTLWERPMTLTRAGNITVNAELVTNP